MFRNTIPLHLAHGQALITYALVRVTWLVNKFEALSSRTLGRRSDVDETEVKELEKVTNYTVEFKYLKISLHL